MKLKFKNEKCLTVMGTKVSVSEYLENRSNAFKVTFTDSWNKGKVFTNVYKWEIENNRHMSTYDSGWCEDGTKANYKLTLLVKGDFLGTESVDGVDFYSQGGEYTAFNTKKELLSYLKEYIMADFRIHNDDFVSGRDYEILKIKAV
tara:strand:+ start:1692 stop:2129 length:438 start_codon:yes stop_codon:yes gene_type:complete